MIHQYEITMSNTACIHCVKLEFYTYPLNMMAYHQMADH